jgi:isochorismate pyruvate lyase
MPKTFKKPSDCKSVDELRDEIDNIDLTLVELMAERFKYVKEVVKYRDPGKKAEYDHNRYLQVLEKRGRWAEEAGLDGTAVKGVFKTLIDYYIEEQKKLANK